MGYGYKDTGVGKKMQEKLAGEPNTKNSVAGKREVIKKTNYPSNYIIKK